MMPFGQAVTHCPQAVQRSGMMCAMPLARISMAPKAQAALAVAQAEAALQAVLVAPAELGGARAAGQAVVEEAARGQLVAALAVDERHPPLLGLDS